MIGNHVDMPRTDSDPLGREGWHAHEPADVVCELAADPDHGLSSGEASERLGRYGPNRLTEDADWTRTKRFTSQFKDVLIWMLAAAAVVSGFVLESWVDAGVIAAIVTLNAVIGYAQETKADAALRSLREFEAPTAAVLRDGVVATIDAHKLVPGDILLLESGNRIPADARVTDSIRLVANEAPLTGESIPVAKNSEPVVDAVSLGERTSMVFSGTTVVSGHGRAVVTATGAETQMGGIAALFSDKQPTTPLQQDLARVGRRLGLVALGAAAVIFGVGLIRGFPVETMALTAVALAVAAIPEGLPAVVTVSLAGGLQRMSRRHAIVRRLPAVETLGAVDVICTDKTGTLTANELQVGGVMLADGRSGASVLEEGEETVRPLVDAAALCNDAYRSSDGLAGDPTEIALLEALEHAGVDFARIRATSPRIDEAAFDGHRKRMSTLHASAGGFVLYVKGAPETVIARSESYLGPRGAEAMRGQGQSVWKQQAEDMAAQGLRVLAFATRHLSQRPDDPADAESELCLIGLIGLSERIRPEVPSALRVAAEAGVTTVMVTGDHATTAKAVADAIGLAGGELMDGHRLSATTTEELTPRIADYRVFARVDPADKVKIIDAWKRSGATVAMTGDGVNDAPALHRADIGVAMGSGTDVARESSAMVLADDNYATIVSAIGEGRRIFSNLRNVVHYLLSANASEVLYVLAGFLLFGHLGEPLLAVQLLWINLMSDSMPAIALGMDLPVRNLMHDRPGQGREILGGRNVVLLLVQGTILAGAALVAMTAGTFVLELDHHAVQTMVFTTLIFSQLLHALSVRAGAGPFRRPARMMIGALVGAALLQLLVVYTPVGNQTLSTTPLSAESLFWAVGASILSMAGVRALNLWLERRYR